MQRLRNDGDAVERRYADLIESRLPFYEKMWSDFIGNDGASRLPLLNRFNHGVNQLREETAHLTYTGLISIICAHRLAARPAGANSVSDLLNAVDLLVGVYGHLGRLRDCVGRVGILWGVPNLAGPLESLYQERNIVLHDALPAMAEYAGTLLIVPPSPNDSIDDKRWNRNRRWSEGNTLHFDALEKHLSETVDRAITATDSLFARLHAAACVKHPQIRDALGSYTTPRPNHADRCIEFIWHSPPVSQRPQLRESGPRAFN